MIRVCESNFIFTCFLRLFTCSSHKLKLAIWPSLMVRVCESNIILPSVWPPVNLSVTLSSFKQLGGIRQGFIFLVWMGASESVCPSVSLAISNTSNEHGDMRWRAHLYLYII